MTSTTPLKNSLEMAFECSKEENDDNISAESSQMAHDQDLEAQAQELRKLGINVVDQSSLEENVEAAVSAFNLFFAQLSKLVYRFYIFTGNVLLSVRLFFFFLRKLCITFFSFYWSYS